MTEISTQLRYQKEPTNHYTDEEVHIYLTNNITSYYKYLRDFYFNIEKYNITLPEKQIFYNKYDGDYRVMPCNINGPEEILSVKIIGSNETQTIIKDKICVGQGMLLHPKDRFLEATFDVSALSSIRTAAISILALEKSIDMTDMTDMTKVPEDVHVFGCGRIGYYTILMLNKIFNIKNFYITDPNLNHYKNLLSLIKDTDIKTTKVDKISSEVVFLCTDSEVSIINKELAKDIKFISSVGADARNLSEVQEDLLESHELIVDSKQSTLIGDIARWNKCSFTELKDTVYKNKVLFISTGTALQDALTMQYIYEGQK